LSARKARRREPLINADHDTLRYSDEFPDAAKLLAAEKMGLEGIVLKKADQPLRLGAQSRLGKGQVPRRARGEQGSLGAVRALLIASNRSGRRRRSSGGCQIHCFLNRSLQRDRVGDGRQAHIIDPRPMNLDSPHIEQARNDTLPKAYLFYGAKLEVRRGATEKTALEYETVVCHRNFSGPDWNHHREKEDNTDRARGRSNQRLPFAVNDACNSKRQQKDKPSESTADEWHPCAVMHDLVRAETLCDVAHLEAETFSCGNQPRWLSAGHHRRRDDPPP
jgi:hypothetical protein